jgi:hypothetical protein
MAGFRIEIPVHRLAVAPPGFVDAVLARADAAGAEIYVGSFEAMVVEGTADQAVITDLMTLARGEW